MARSKSRSDHYVAHLHPPTNLPTKYQLATPYGLRDTARTTFFQPPTAHLPTQPDNMGENKTPTALKGCGVKTLSLLCIAILNLSLTMRRTPADTVTRAGNKRPSAGTPHSKTRAHPIPHHWQQATTKNRCIVGKNNYQ